MLEQQEAAAQAKMEDLQEQDAVRERRLEEQKFAKIEESRMKRAMTEKRIRDALRGQQTVEAERRARFQEKNRQTLELMDKRRGEEEREQEQRLKKLHQKEEKRQMAMDAAKEHEDDRIDQILKHAEEREAQVYAMREERFQTDMVKTVKERLKKQDKVDNIERMKRIDEFLRLQTLQKIQLDNDRSKKLQHSKSTLLQEVGRWGGGEGKLQEYRPREYRGRERRDSGWQ